MMTPASDVHRPGDSAPRRPAFLRALVLVALVVSILGLAACAAGTNPDLGTPSDDGDTAGFWLGLWQGIILPVTFVVSLFTDSVSIYEVHNNGNWYDFGFVLGLGLFVGGPFGVFRGSRDH